MIKNCPFISYQISIGSVYCMENECSLWDEKRNQCCILTQALAAADKPSEETKPIYFDIGHPPLEDPDYVSPRSLNGAGNPYRIEGSSTCNTDDITKKLNIKIKSFEGGPTE